MKALKLILLFLTAALLAAIVVAAQCIITLQWTVLRPTFLTGQLDKVLAVMETPEIRAQNVDQVVRLIQRNVRYPIPQDIRGVIRGALDTAIDHTWIRKETVSAANQFLLLLKGKTKQLDLTIYLARRKEVFLRELSNQLDRQTVAQLERGRSAVPDRIDLASEIGADTMRVLRGFGKYNMATSVLVVYVLPVVFVVLCVWLSSLGLGLVAAGSGGVVGGLLVIMATSAGRFGIGDLMAGAIARHLPGDVAWLERPLLSTVSEILIKGRSVATPFLVVSAVLVAIGLLLVRLTLLSKRDGE